MFIKNKYTQCYQKIINRSQNRQLVDEYTERHHIIPKSMGGDDNIHNIATLTAREHFICHLLLTKMVSGPLLHKAIKAARMMAIITGPGQQRYKVNSRIYEILMRNLTVPEEVRQNMSAGQKQRFSKSPGTFKNKKHKEETLVKLRRPKSEEQKLNQSIVMTGRFKGRVPHNKGKTYEELYGEKRAIELKEKVKKLGEKNGFYGKQHSAEQRERKRQEKLATPKKVCYYCNKEVDPMNYGRWHGNNCKHKK